MQGIWTCNQTQFSLGELSWSHASSFRKLLKNNQNKNNTWGMCTCEALRDIRKLLAIVFKEGVREPVLKWPSHGLFLLSLGTYFISLRAYLRNKIILVSPCCKDCTWNVSNASPVASTWACVACWLTSRERSSKKVVYEEASLMSGNVVPSPCSTTCPCGFLDPPFKLRLQTLQLQKVVTGKICPFFNPFAVLKAHPGLK